MDRIYEKKIYFYNLIDQIMISFTILLMVAFITIFFIITVVLYKIEKFSIVDSIVIGIQVSALIFLCIVTIIIVGMGYLGSLSQIYEISFLGFILTIIALLSSEIGRRFHDLNERKKISKIEELAEKIEELSQKIDELE